MNFKRILCITFITAAFMLSPVIPVVAEKESKGGVPDYSLTERKDIPVEYTWSVEDIYPGLEEWKKGKARFDEMIAQMGTLSKDWTTSPGKMLALLKLKDEIEKTINQSPSTTRSTNASDITFYYNDKKDDVGVVDYRSEDYPDAVGFDIKSITSEISGSYLWLNMTIHDLIQDDEDIYYKMTAANVEVLFFRGDGEIIYGDSMDSIVTYSDKTLSAKINTNEFVYDNFQICFKCIIMERIGISQHFTDSLLYSFSYLPVT